MRASEVFAQICKAHRGMLIVVALLMAANLLIFLTLEQMLLPKLTAQEHSYLQRQSEVRQLLRNKGGLDHTPEQLYLSARKDLAEFREMMPAYQDFTSLVEELLVLSSRSGLNITQVNYQPGKTLENDLLRYGLSFAVSGRYAQIKKFIHALEQSQRILVISQIRLQSTEGGEVNLRLNLETFFRKEKVES